MAKRGRVWIAVDVDFFDDPETQALGPITSMLYLRMCAYAKRCRTDGFVPQVLAHSMAPFKIENGHKRASKRDENGHKRCTILTEMGWLEDAILCGQPAYKISAWTDWYDPAAEAKIVQRRKKQREKKRRQRQQVSGDVGVSPGDVPRDVPRDVPPPVPPVSLEQHSSFPRTRARRETETELTNKNRDPGSQTGEATSMPGSRPTVVKTTSDPAIEAARRLIGNLVGSEGSSSA